MIDAILEPLNEPQREAVQHVEGPLLILAGAGSGKTRVLTHRTAYLIAAGAARPDEILSVTFTNKAAREMRERIEAMLDPETAGRVSIRTFHAFGLRLLRSGFLELELGREAAVCDPADTEQLVRELLRELVQRGADENVRGDARAFLRLVEARKREGLLPGEHPDDDRPFKRTSEVTIGQLYAEYQRRLEQARLLDFGDLLLWPVRILEEREELRARLAERFRFVMVDEFQDTNAIQVRLLRALAGGHRNLAVVGDDNQAIYSWRGARVDYILDFERHLMRGAHVVELPYNYRSSQLILDAAWEVVRGITRPGRRPLRAAGAHASLDEPIRYAELEHPEAEAAWIARQVRTLREQGTPLAEMAIFYRTNAQSRVFEEVLRNNDVPYRLVGGTAFYERAEIKDVLAYLRLLVNPRDAVSFWRIGNRPTRGIGDKSRRAVVAHAQAHDLELPAAAADLIARGELRGRAGRATAAFFELLGEFRARIEHEEDLPGLVRELLERAGYLTYLDEQDRREGLERIGEGRRANVEELLTAVARYEQTAETPTLAGYLDEVTLVQDDQEEATDDRVALMTLHAAKGLEFDVVFIAGVERGLIPLERSDDQGGEREAEERRLLYVGMTRARRRLYLTRAWRRQRYGRTEISRRSPFLAEIPDRYLEDLTPRRAAGTIRFPFSAPPLGTPNPGGHPSGRVGTRGADSGTVGGGAGEVRWVPEAYRPGNRLHHPSFGVGVVLSAVPGSNGWKLRMRFASGEKTILSQYVELTPC